MRSPRGVPGAALAAALLTAWAGGAAAEPAHVTILQVNDWDRIGEEDSRGGFARLLTILEKENAAADDVLFVHAGDALSPSLLSGFDKGAHMIDVLNRTPLDLFVLGNHEFDFGPDVLKARLAEASFPIVNSNADEPGGRLLDGTVESLMIEVGGYKLGFFGLTTPETEQSASPAPVTFRPVLETAKAMSQKLEEAGADLVIAVAHVDRTDDAALMEAGVADLILSGHDHDLRILYDGRTALVESASQASYVTAIDLVLDRIETNGRSRVTWHPSFRTLDSAAVEPDARGLELIKAYEGKLAAELDMVIGRTMTALDSRRGTVRAQEAAVGNLIADAMRTAVGADVAMTNGGGIRGDRVYEAGTVLTRRDIQRELPFGNRTVKLEVTGAELLAALENGFSRVEEEAGRFPQVSGMRVEVDLAKPGGARVQAVEVAGKPLEPEGRYILATNDYMARGGDGYEALASARRLVNEASARLLASQVIDHIAARGEVAARVEGRIIRAE